MRIYKDMQTLTYVPNSYCNFGCKYCYLGKLTEKDNTPEDSVKNLEKIIEEYENSNILINHITFHGAEITTLPNATLDKLFTVCRNYYN